MKHKTKLLIIIIYSLLLLALGTATFVEHLHGTDAAANSIYHSPWFCLAWAVLALLGLAVMVRLRLWRRWGVFLLHSAFIVILIGAAVTFLTSKKGFVHLQTGVPARSFLLPGKAESQPLPFALVLDSFAVKCYAGTEAPSDFLSYVSIMDGNGSAEPQHACISMNRILSHEGYRFYQSSYDDDYQGSYLTVNYDPWGTGITYVGYALLLLGMIATLANRREEFRSLLRNPLLRGGLVVALFFVLGGEAQAKRSLPAFNREKADSLARKQVVYNDRVAPFSTLAHDFLLKLYGGASYGGLTPEQVVSGWLFSPEVWQNEPMILIKNAQLRQLLHIEGKYARLTDLFHGDDYILQHYWKGADNPQFTPTDALQKAILETDEKVGLIMMLQKGTLIQPLPRDGSVETLSPARVEAEVLYNRLPLTKVLFMANLCLGLIAFFCTMRRQMQKGKSSNVGRKFILSNEFLLSRLLPACLYLATLVLAFAYGLRWYVAGHIPMSNGFETMQFMALAAGVVACLLHRRFPVLLPFGFLLAGFALLVAHLGQSNPQVTNLMPVLSSPWLSLHVSVVMVGYALLAFLALTGVMGLCLPQSAERLMLLGRLLLYPAVFFLGTGIFLGAVWANQSWGSYWSWDPKEVWALITFMIYAVPFHSSSLRRLQRPRWFHAYCAAAFLCVLMTYFGVNFVLGGMHSYAG